jgi:hypothetical protein
MITVFQKNFVAKKVFDPNDENDVDIFKKFLIENKWPKSGCPFMLENPYISIPHMIQEKIVRNLFKI